MTMHPRCCTIVFALVLSTAAAAADPIAEAAAWNSRASELADQERLTEAEAAYRLAIRLIEQEAGMEVPQLAQLLNDLAIVYRRLGRLRDAERCYHRSLAIRPATLVRINLARLYQQMGRHRDAGELLREAIRRTGAEDKPGLAAAARHTHAALLLATGRLEASLSETSSALRLWRAASRPADAAKALGMRAEILRRMKRYREAAAAFERALPAARAALGERHPEVGRMLWAHSRTLAKLGRNREAKALRNEAKVTLAAAPGRVAQEHIVDASEWLEAKPDEPR